MDEVECTPWRNRAHVIGLVSLPSAEVYGPVGITASVCFYYKFGVRFR